MKMFLRAVLAACAPTIAAAEDEAVRTGWLKTFAAAPIGAGEAFVAPDYHGTLIEDAARRSMRERLEARGRRQAGDDAMDEPLTVSIDVDAPGPKGRKPLPKSPVQISSYDRNLDDHIYDPKIYADIVDLPKRAKDAAPEIRVTIYARRGDERVWSGYAGAPAGGASREAIAGGLAAALIDHFGETVDVGAAPFTLAAATPVMRIIETPDE